MAKAIKKTTKKTSTFLVLTSACGDFDQARAEYCHPSGGYSSIEAAKKAAPEHVTEHSNDNGDTPSRVFIVEVVAIGEPNGLTWTK